MAVTTKKPRKWLVIRPGLLGLEGYPIQIERRPDGYIMVNVDGHSHGITIGHVSAMRIGERCADELDVFGLAE